MSIVSIAEFQEIIRSAFDYYPYKERNQNEHPSGELYQSGGNTINSIKLKFLIEDDGGNWDDLLLVKPQIIYDFKKIIAGSIIDDGSLKIDLAVTRPVKETDDGLEFYGTSESYIQSELKVIDDLDFSKFILNCWFTPQYVNNTGGVLFSIYDPDLTLFTVVIMSDNLLLGTFKILVFGRLTGGVTFAQFITSGPRTIFRYGKKTNLQVSFYNGDFQVRVNGETIVSDTHNALDISGYKRIMIGSQYKGEISYISVNALWSLTDQQRINLWKFGYPLPRKKEYVDLSTYFHENGLNLLLDIGDINKTIENFRGQLFVRTNTIKMRN